MHSADCAVARCLSVRLSVRHTPILSVNGYTYPQNLFTIGYSHHSSFFIPKFRREPPERGRRMQVGMKKSQFSTNISLYLANDARYSHSYYGRRIGNRTQLFEWYRFEWPWVTSIFQGHDIIQRQITKKRYQIELYLQWRTNRKSYMLYRTAPFSMTLNNP